jgi:5'-3' exonuclease
MKFDIMIVDGNSYAHRAGSVMYLSNEKGEPTAVAYGMLNMLRSLLEQNDIGEICICWDYKGYTSKKAIYPEYKGDRKQKREDAGQHELYIEILKQINELYEILPAFGIKQLRKEGVEADDLIGLLVEEMLQRNRKDILVVSGDRDLFQLVDHGITIYFPNKDIYLTEENFEKEVEDEGVKLEIPPYLYIFYKTLKGDAGDNIKGLGGFGKKTATRLLKEYGAWTEWFEQGKPKVEILLKLNKAQKAKLLSKDALDILIRNFNLMSAGYLDADKMGDVIMDYYGQKPVFEEDKIRTFFESKEFTSRLAQFRAWLHPFKMLHYREEKEDDNDKEGTQGV